MRLATFNVLHGRSLTDGRVEADRLVEAVRRIAADVLALQEVDRQQRRSGSLDLTEIAATAGGFAAWRFQPSMIGPAGNWRAATPADEGEPGPAYGVALLSRYPVEAWDVLRLRAAPMRSPVLVAAPRRVLLVADEPRVVVAAVLATPIGRVTVAAAHLSFVPGWNATQLLRLARWLRRKPSPQVLLGDLNLPGRVPSLLTGWSMLARSPTYPADLPRWQLDHALGRGKLPAVRSVDTPLLPVSDHRALVIELTA